MQSDVIQLFCSMCSYDFELDLHNMRHNKLVITACPCCGEQEAHDVQQALDKMAESDRMAK